ncbi:hypothetical protein TNCV_947691 [Trichonephila clavipes]|nr:hypothetical protein TNCV_947691 [Trichonephila clavipes]
MTNREARLSRYLSRGKPARANISLFASLLLPFSYPIPPSQNIQPEILKYLQAVRCYVIKQGKVWNGGVRRRVPPFLVADASIEEKIPQGKIVWGQGVPNL